MPLRVHAFARRFPNLSQTFVRNQCTGLCELGVDLTVFAEGADNTGFASAEAAASDFPLPVRYHGIPEPWSNRPLPALRALLGPSSLGWNQRLRLLAPWHGGREAISLRLLFEGLAVHRAAPAHMLHAHFGPAGAMVESLRRAGVVDAPLVTTFYGYDVSRTPAALYRRLFERGECFLALSDAMRTRLIAMGAPAERVHVHRLGVDLTQFTPGVRAARDANAGLHLVSIARLVPKKGLAVALQAIARVKADIPGLRYTIVGDGPLRKELEQLTHNLGINPVVHFVGWRAQPEVLAIARAAHVLLAPSVTGPDGDAEGTPMAILEAQALGLPVLSTHHAGIPEVVEQGVSALLVHEHDVEGLARAILAVAEPGVARAMGDAGRALMEQAHDIRRLNRALLDRFQSLKR